MQKKTKNACSISKTMQKKTKMQKGAKIHSQFQTFLVNCFDKIMEHYLRGQHITVNV